MISIGKIYKKENGDWRELHANVKISSDTANRFIKETDKLKNVSWLTKWDYPPASWNDDNSSLWFAVPSKYGKYLCKERSNAFILAFLWYAMVTESDIEFQVPMSKKMYEGITNKLIPSISKEGYAPIKLIGPVSEEPVWNEGKVGTGLTCGADSTYTLHKYEGVNVPKEEKLTHIVFCYADYLFPYIEPPYDVDKIIAEFEQKYSKKEANESYIMATHHGLPHIEIRTNFDRDYYRGGLIYTGMYRFFSCTMALEHLFSTYIFTSSGSGEEKEVASLFKPHYEDLLCECCSSEDFRFIISDHEERYTKLQVIADDVDFQKLVEVCDNIDVVCEKNCGDCFGCWKTMVPLDMLGKLDKYSERFDLDKYYSNRSGVFEKMIRFSQRPESELPRRIVAQILKHVDESREVGALFKEVYEECYGGKK